MPVRVGPTGRAARATPLRVARPGNVQVARGRVTSQERLIQGAAPTFASEVTATCLRVRGERRYGSSRRSPTTTCVLTFAAPRPRSGNRALKMRSGRINSQETPG